MEIVVVDPDYPREENLYGDVFVHTRVKGYPLHWKVRVIGLNTLLKDDVRYTWDGVDVFMSCDVNKVKQEILNAKPQILVIHFIQWQMMDFFLSINRPLAIFVHGYEALSWRRRLFDYNSLGALRYLPAYFFKNTKQLKWFHDFVTKANQRKDICFVFVSEWMKRIASADVKVAFNYSKIIPNGIDSALFNYAEKDVAQRKKILLIRSFNSRKYAVDIAVDSILELSDKPFFNELTIELHGKGYLFKQLTAPLAKFKNVFCYNNFLRQDEIAEKHKQFGIFLSPTRQDAQGVSMCEAMASGLVPITSSVTAIPEFVKDGVSGYTTKSAKEIAARIEYLYTNPTLFSEMSHNATEAISKKCSVKITMPKEVELIESMISNS